jgi:PEP-CTERM motif
MFYLVVLILPSALHRNSSRLQISASIPLAAIGLRGDHMIRHAVSIACVVMSLAIVAGSPALADVLQTYNLSWSGSFLGNSASASGTMTLDLTTLIDPTVPGAGLEGTSDFDIVSDITSLTVTVTGASSGNGAFTKSDLCACSDFGSFTLWDTNSATVNMHADVLAQLTIDDGDFNLFFTAPGPQGSEELTLTTNGLSGDPMEMTKFAPTVGRRAPVPEPATWVMMGLGFASLAFGGLRARRHSRSKDGRLSTPYATA